MRSLIFAIFLMLTQPAQAETVDVKYWGSVDLDAYECTDTVSSFVHRICYIASTENVVVEGLINALGCAGTTD